MTNKSNQLGASLNRYNSNQNNLSRKEQLMDIELGGVNMTQSNTFNNNKQFIPVNQNINAQIYRNHNQHQNEYNNIPNFRGLNNYQQPNNFQQPVSNYQENNFQHNYQPKTVHITNNQPQSQYFSLPFRPNQQSH